ncbi:hypothetical protein [Marinoscillum sp. 108]|uniref:hypothetical protein n=1 Tax=Marinoscillum sp. 108 TaxID=2653151 RepID=UPI0012F0146A|nr:hypothetical protein [Marinoscillum sp. 108]VXD19583.1 exported hypothetical protein [Marinoscillum sp. 108]
MKYIAAFCFLLLLGNLTNAQTINLNVPDPSSLKTAEDYKPLEETVIELLQSLTKDRYRINKSSRLEADNFVSKWLNGCPYLHMYLHQAVVMGLIEEKATYGKELFTTYHFGVALHMLMNQDKDYDGTEYEIQVAGINTMYESYIKLNPQQKSKTMENYGKLIRKNKLLEWVEKNVEFENTHGVKLN